MEADGMGFQSAIAERKKPKQRRKIRKPRFSRSQRFIGSSVGSCGPARVEPSCVRRRAKLRVGTSVECTLRPDGCHCEPTGTCEANKTCGPRRIVTQAAFA